MDSPRLSTDAHRGYKQNPHEAGHCANAHAHAASRNVFFTGRIPTWMICFRCIRPEREAPKAQMRVCGTKAGVIHLATAHNGTLISPGSMSAVFSAHILSHSPLVSLHSSSFDLPPPLSSSVLIITSAPRTPFPLLLFLSEPTSLPLCCSRLLSIDTSGTHTLHTSRLFQQCFWEVLHHGSYMSQTRPRRYGPNPVL